MTQRVRVGIVNDLAVACEALRRAIATDPALEVIWIARDGREAVDAARRARADVVLMDLIMPVMDGVAATREIMRTAPCPILVVTATVSGNAGLVYEALGAGALDAVNTPTFADSSTLKGAEDLLRRIRRIARIEPATSDVRHAAEPPRMVGSAGAGAASIIAIGASTGGPRATADLIAALPRPCGAAILVVQHLSAPFVPGYADWLAGATGHRVVIARAGDRPSAGDVLIADGELHMALSPQGSIEYREQPSASLHRPSVDELFASLAANTRPGIAVLLTGMGRDGAAGMLRLRQAGWHTIAQDERSSVVWGMPAAAVQLGAAVETLAPPAIAQSIAARIRSRAIH